MTDIALFSPLGRGGDRAHGGITSVVRELANGLCDLGLEVTLLTFAPADPRALVPGLDPRLRIHNLGPGGRRRHRHRIAAWLRRHRPRALLAAGHRANLIAAALVDVAHRSRPPTRIVLGVHNAPGPGLSELGPLRRWLRLRSLRHRYPLADALVCVSAGVAADLTALVPRLGARVEVIHNPIAASAAQAPAAHPWLADDGPPVILGAGRLTRQKGFDLLIRAIALVRDPVPPRLVIIGDGDARPALLRLARTLGVGGRVALPGFVSSPRAQMARASLFVLASRWEGFGNVLVEAMSVGTPVVATDCPSGPREILQDGRLGALVPPEDPAALAAAIAGTLASPPASAEALRARAASFAPVRVAARYRALLLGEPSP